MFSRDYGYEIDDLGPGGSQPRTVRTPSNATACWGAVIQARYICALASAGSLVEIRPGRRDRGHASAARTVVSLRVPSFLRAAVTT